MRKRRQRRKRNEELTRRLRYLGSPLSSAKFVRKSFARSVRDEREGLKRRSKYARKGERRGGKG